LSDFQRGQVVGVHLAGASLTKTTTLLDASRASVLRVRTACRNHGKTLSAEKNSGRKTKL